MKRETKLTQKEQEQVAADVERVQCRAERDDGRIAQYPGQIQKQTAAHGREGVRQPTGALDQFSFEEVRG